MGMSERGKETVFRDKNPFQNTLNKRPSGPFIYVGVVQLKSLENRCNRYLKESTIFMEGLCNGTFSVKTGMSKCKDLDLVASCVGASFRILSLPPSLAPPPSFCHSGIC